MHSIAHRSDHSRWLLRKQFHSALAAARKSKSKTLHLSSPAAAAPNGSLISSALVYHSRASYMNARHDALHVGILHYAVSRHAYNTRYFFLHPASPIVSLYLHGIAYFPRLRIHTVRRAIYFLRVYKLWCGYICVRTSNYLLRRGARGAVAYGFRETAAEIYNEACNLGVVNVIFTRRFNNVV